jgi:hypothetical protein
MMINSSEALAMAVEGMADTLMELTMGDTFAGMTCREAESIAAVLVVAGRMNAAAHVVMMHGDGDDEQDDRHHDVHAALREPGAGFSHNEADEPFQLAMVHARELA